MEFQECVDDVEDDTFPYNDKEGPKENNPKEAAEVSEDSDSAPEETSLQASKEMADSQRKGYEKAMRKLKEDKRERVKKRREFFKEQKEKKLARIQELESKKLPDDFLAGLSSSTLVAAQSQEPAAADKSGSGKARNKKKVFNSDVSDNEGSDAEMNPTSATDGFLALETERTNFHVVSSKDLQRSGKNATAFSFREQMLFKNNRLKRVSHQQRQKLDLKKTLGGRNSMVKTST